MSKSVKTGNVGEWSEVYVFFDILGTHTIYPCDEKLHKYNEGYPVLEIIRIGKKEEEHFVFHADSLTWHKNTDSGGSEIVIDAEKCSQAAKDFLVELKAIQKKRKEENDKKRSFEMPRAYGNLQSFEATKFKADSKKKTDIRLKISDSRSGMSPICGFSIKSFLGGLPTLFNASKGGKRDGRKGSSSFIYKVNLPNISESIVKELNKTSAEDIVKEVYNRGGSFEYLETTQEGTTFRNNLRYIDAYMPKMLAELSLFYRRHGINSTDKATRDFAKKDIFNFGSHKWYEYKIKKLLEASALGMTAGTPWQGDEDANGGFIIVKPNGEVVTYHIYHRAELLNYLFSGTTFDHCSQSAKKFDYGKIFKDSISGDWLFRLQLQIRYKRVAH